MSGTDNCLDKEMAMRLLTHGVFLTTEVPPLTRPEALVLLAEAALDRFVKEFKGLVRELLLGCQLRDFQATPAEIQTWLGEDWERADAGPCDAKECPPRAIGALHQVQDRL